MLIRNSAKGKASENRYTKKKYIRNTKYVMPTPHEFGPPNSSRESIIRRGQCPNGPTTDIENLTVISTYKEARVCSPWTETNFAKSNRRAQEIQ